MGGNETELEWPILCGMRNCHRRDAENAEKIFLKTFTLARILGNPVNFFRRAGEVVVFLIGEVTNLACGIPLAKISDDIRWVIMTLESPSCSPTIDH